MRISNSNKGITLIELILTIGLTAIIITAVYSMFILALRNWEHLEPKTLLQQEAMIAMAKMERELKKCGAIIVANNQDIEFSRLPETIPSLDDYVVALWHMDEGSTGSADKDRITDDSGNRNKGKISSCQWISTGENNNAIESDGTIDDYISCGKRNSLNITDQLTLEAWIRPNSGSSDQAIIYKDEAYRLYINASDKLVGSIYYGGAWHDVIGVTPVIRNGSTWTHARLTYDYQEGGAEELKIYINGAIDNTADHSTQITSSGTNLYLFQDHDNLQYTFNGAIDEVRISNTVRKTNFSWTGVRYVISENLADKLTITVNNESWQLVDGYTQTFILEYYDSNNVQLTPTVDTDTQTERNDIKTIKILLELEKYGTEFDLENIVVLRKDEHGSEIIDNTEGSFGTGIYYQTRFIIDHIELDLE